MLSQLVISYFDAGGEDRFSPVHSLIAYRQGTRITSELTRAAIMNNFEAEGQAKASTIRIYVGAGG